MIAKFFFWEKTACKTIFLAKCRWLSLIAIDFQPKKSFCRRFLPKKKIGYHFFSQIYFFLKKNLAISQMSHAIIKNFLTKLPDFGIKRRYQTYFVVGDSCPIVRWFVGILTVTHNYIVGITKQYLPLNFAE